jgi:hypothetical protein
VLSLSFVFHEEQERGNFGTTENRTFRIDSTNFIEIDQNDKDDENEDASGVISFGGLHTHGG